MLDGQASSDKTRRSYTVLDGVICGGFGYYVGQILLRVGGVRTLQPRTMQITLGPFLQEGTTKHTFDQCVLL